MEVETDCEDLRVFFNAARAFVEGLIVPFDFRITPLNPDVTDLFLEIRHGDNLIARDEPDEFPRVGREMRFHLAFNAPTGLRGEVPFKIYVGYRRDENEHTYVAKRVHTVFRAKEKARDVIQNLKIVMHNSTTARNASDPSVRQQINGLDEFCPRPDDPAEDFKFVKLPPFWEPLELRKCRFKPISSRALGRVLHQRTPPVPATCAHLTLRLGERRLHLLSGDLLQVGRNKSCDILTRNLDSDGIATEALNERISRYHCRIRRQHGVCEVADRAWDPDTRTTKPSAHGTFLQGKPIPRGESAVLPKDIGFLLTLGAAEREAPGAFAFEGTLMTSARIVGSAPQCSDCEAKDGIECMVLSPYPPRDEQFVVVWGRVVLGLLDLQLGSACLCRAQGAFLVRDGNNCTWLEPGKTLFLSGTSIAIESYNPLGWKSEKRKGGKKT